MKRLLDIFLASIALSFLILPLLFVMLLIRMTSSGDSLFVQTRIGKDSRPFNIYKLRTMDSDSDFNIHELSDTQTPFFKLKNDPRVTPLGRVLRKLSIDELPQLVNVIRGDMSLVGPRPQIAEEVALYDTLHAGRLAVRPGLTGLWQISGRSDLDFDEGIALDLFYVDNHSMWLDLKILLKTPFVLSKGAY